MMISRKTTLFAAGIAAALAIAASPTGTGALAMKGMTSMSGMGLSRAKVKGMGGMVMKKKKKKKSRCPDPDQAKIATYKVEKGPNFPVAINASLTGTPGDAAKGEKMMTSKRKGNCMSCHAVNAWKPKIKKAPKRYSYMGEIGPELDGVGERITLGEMRAMLVDPKTNFPETIMPAFHRATGLHRVGFGCQGKAMLTAQQVEDILAVLVMLK